MPARSAQRLLRALFHGVVACLAVFVGRPAAAQSTAPLTYARIDTAAGFTNGTYHPIRFRPGLPGVPLPAEIDAAGAEHALLGLDGARDSLLVVLDGAGGRTFFAAWRDGSPFGWQAAVPGVDERGSRTIVAEADLRPAEAQHDAAPRRLALEVVLLEGPKLYRLADARFGKVELDGRSHRVAVTRGSGSLDFSNLRGATVFVDLDGDGAFRDAGEVDPDGVYRPAEAFAADRPFAVRGTAYEVASIAPDGSVITIRPAADRTGLAVGLRAPDFSVVTLAGDTLSSADFRGRLLVVNWWGTWCSPCLEEIPGLNALVDRHDPEEVAFLAIAEDSREALEAFLAELPFDYVQALSDASTRALFGSPWPQHLIIDRDGTVVLRESGGSAARGAELGRVIQALLDRS